MIKIHKSNGMDMDLLNVFLPIRTRDISMTFERNGDKQKETPEVTELIKCVFVCKRETHTYTHYGLSHEHQ